MHAITIATNVRYHTTRICSWFIFFIPRVKTRAWHRVIPRPEIVSPYDIVLNPPFMITTNTIQRRTVIRYLEYLCYLRHPFIASTHSLSPPLYSPFRMHYFDWLIDWLINTTKHEWYVRSCFGHGAGSVEWRMEIFLGQFAVHGHTTGCQRSLSGMCCLLLLVYDS